MRSLLRTLVAGVLLASVAVHARHVHRRSSSSSSAHVSLSESAASTGPAPSPSCLLPTGFVHLRDVAPSVIQEIRYASMHNFVGRVIDGYEAPECILSVEAATAIAKVQDYLMSGAADPVNNQKYSLKMYDCYRPTSAVADFVSWSQNASDTLMQTEFYPEQNKADLFSLGYIALKSGHSKGSTMDLTVVPLPAGPEQVKEDEQAACGRTYIPGVTKLESCFAPEGVRWEDNCLDMGTGFDCFSTKAWTNDTSVSVLAQFNRLLLLQAMTLQGNFLNYDEEWWHYTLIDEPFPDTYFNFPVC